MILRSLLFLTCILGALNAGFFFTWSFTVLQGLNTIDPAVAVSAMQGINNNIRSFAFGAVFFGTPALGLLTGLGLLLTRKRLSGALTLVGALSLVASVAITALMNLPLNEALAGANQAHVDALWQAYSSAWLSANHLRLGTSLLGAGLFLFAWRRC